MLQEVRTLPTASPDLAQKLAAYVPLTLTRQIVATGLPTPGTPHALQAATLFSDISGFTSMSEELASDGPRGAEEVNRVLLLTFTAMIDAIHELGGAVSHFYGDAMSVYFPDDDGQAAQRALFCAQQMQQLMRMSFARVVTNRPAGKSPFFPLTIKIGLGYGRCQELIVGHPAGSLEFVLTGPAVDEAAVAEKHATAGQVTASRAILQRAGLPAPAPFSLLDQPLAPVAPRPLLDWHSLPPDYSDRLATAAAPFVAPALYQRIIAESDGLAEHRPVTSLFVQFELDAADADAADADAADADNATAGQQLQAYYAWACELVARFGSSNGRVNRVLTGDKGNQLHIMFGAPVAPDAPAQALLCALALQAERPAYVTAQRIGVAVGKVFAGPVGATARREYTVVGDVVNLSARLMQQCAAGQVLTDVLTAERCAEAIEFEALPAVHLKGKQQAVVPYRAVAERTGATQLQAYFKAERPLVGRDAELDLLLGALDMAQQGAGSLAAVVGGAGVGKTRLLAAAIQQWTARGGLGLLGICHPHTADTPYAPWRSIWSDFFGLTPGMDTAARVAALVDGTHALAPDAGEDVGLWAEVMGLPIPQSAALLELTAEARQARFFALVQRCFRARTAVRPLLCILENIHWADQASLALIDHLAPQLNSMPLAIAVTFRDSNFDLTLDALAHPICQTLPLQDLTPAEARGLLHALLGVRQLPAAVEQQLGLRDREGRDSPVNPLFLEEAVNVMLDVGVLRRGAQLAIDEARLSQVQLPDTIHGLLLARLDRLPPASRDLLQVASVIGRQFGREPLHRMTPNLARGAVSELLDMLSAEEMTRLVTADPEWIYLFQHAMTHEVAYESLPYARRQALHNGLASWLEEAYAGSLKPLHPILAYHYSRADAHAQALDYAIKAANDARDIFANRDAVELYVLAERHLQALGEAAHWETAVELYLARGHVQILLGDLARAMGDAERGLALAQAHDARAAMATSYNLMAEIQYRQGQLDEVNACIAHVIDELKTAASPDQLARAYVYGGWVASARLEYDRAIALLQQAEAICTATNNNIRLALALEAMAYTYYGQRQLEQALAAMQRSAELSRRFSTRVNVGFALNNVAFLQLETGKPRQALDTFDDAVRIGRETSHTLLAIALYNRAAVHAYLGQFTAARAGFEEAVHLLDPRQHARQLVEAHLFWGYDYCCALGDWEGARVQFARARALIDQQPENFPEEQARLLLGLGYALLRSGDQAAARQTLEEARLLITARELAWWQPAICYYRGLLQREAGDPAAAAETLDAGLAAIEAGGSPDYLPLLLLEAARLLPPGPQRDACLRRSLRSADRRARHADRLRCYREVGQLLADHPDAGFRALGRESLAKAVEMGGSEGG